mgnify:CR=1 FL=1
MGIEVKNIGEVEGLDTSEGVMKPLVFGERLAVIHLEIPAGLEVSPHAHSMEGVIYCLSGDLEVKFGSETVTIGNGTAMLVPPNTEVGIKNRQDATANAILVSSPPPVRSVEELKDLIEHYNRGDKDA